LAIDEESIVDTGSDEGKQLLDKYDIENVPTIILDGDLEVYDNFKAVWENVGTIEDDGTYVFRTITAMGQGIVYNDLAAGEIKGLSPATPTEQSS
jgi:hypothetical protein